MTCLLGICEPVVSRPFSPQPTRLINENEVKQWRDQAEKFRKGEGLCLDLLWPPRIPSPAQLRTHLPYRRGTHVGTFSLPTSFPDSLPPQNTQSW